MDFLLGVEIDNRRIAWIFDSGRPPASAARLTTVSDNQQKAILHFFIKHSRKKETLFTETLTGLPRISEGRPLIDIVPRISGKSLNYEIYVNGKLVRRSTHSLKKYMRNRKPLIIAAISAGLIISAVLLFFIPVSPFHHAPGGEAVIPHKETVVPASNDAASAEEEPPAADEQKTAVRSETPEASGPVFTDSEISDRHSVYFNPDSSELTFEAISSLRNFINELPRRGDFTKGNFKMEVRGHCARFGTEEGRAELSRERAVNVYNFLETEWGIKADSLVTGVGASEPLTLNRDEQYLNRRVDIYIKGNITKEKNND